MNLPYFCKENTNIQQFAKIWAEAYDDKNEPLYDQNIGKLTKEAIEKLFIWKNGNLLSEKKTKSVHGNYILKLEHLKTLSKQISPEQFLRKEFSGGMIWKFIYYISGNQKNTLYSTNMFTAQ